MADKFLLHGGYSVHIPGITVVMVVVAMVMMAGMVMMMPVVLMMMMVMTTGAVVVMMVMMVIMTVRMAVMGILTVRMARKIMGVMMKLTVIVMMMMAMMQLVLLIGITVFGSIFVLLGDMSNPEVLPHHSVFKGSFYFVSALMAESGVRGKESLLCGIRGARGSLCLWGLWLWGLCICFREMFAPAASAHWGGDRSSSVLQQDQSYVGNCSQVGSESRRI